MGTTEIQSVREVSESIEQSLQPPGEDTLEVS